MCEPNIEELVTYLSTKFNRIFCDRDFVCCVSNDFHIIRNKSKCRVLVFPILGPVYQRALKYQAEAFDFATFELSAGIYKFIAVCQKEYIIKKEKEDLKMGIERNVDSEAVQDNNGRKRRPERQLYIPPAQRRLATTTETDNETKLSKETKCNASNEKINKPGRIRKQRKQPNQTDDKKITSCRTEYKVDDTKLIDLCVEKKNIGENNYYIPSLIDLIKLDLLSLPTYNQVFLRNSIPSLSFFHDDFCEFHNYLTTRYKNDLKLGISIFHIDNNQVSEISKDKISWQTFFPQTYTGSLENLQNDIKSESDHLTLSQTKLCATIKLRYSSERIGIMPNDIIGDSSEVDVIFKTNCASSEEIYECDSELFENIVDLTEFNLGHFFKMKLSENEHFHVCSQSHDVKNCYFEVKRSLMNETSLKKDEKQPSERNEPKTTDKSVHKKKEPEVIRISEVETTNAKFEKKQIMDSKKKCHHDEEIEIMRRTKENINRKTRPLMKYSDEGDDLLRIGKQDNVNNWEDLFDEDGQIQEELLTEIVHKVGKDMKIVKATEDYTPYMPKSTDELDHVVEIYNFPSSLSTGDIIHAFSMFDSDSMYVVWVDDTHALLVLGSSSQAQKAVEVKNPFIKVRPLSKGSVAAVTAASKYDLKPAMKRPQTNLQTARRLITTHLGAKSQISREQRAMERENLRKAREQKKLMRQNEKDAWEGNFH